MLKEFREFLEKFNVIPAAVGLVLALAVLPVMNAVVALILTLIAIVTGMEPNEEGVYDIAAGLSPGGVSLSPLLNALFSFILIAFVVFMLVKALNKAGADTTPAETPDQALLAEIRDAIKSR